MRHHGHHHRSSRHFRKPFSWILARGVHRRIVMVVAAALMGGVVTGAFVHSQAAKGAGLGSVLCVALAMLMFAWPFTWMATWTVMRPLRQLAEVAGRLQEGRLDSRTEIPEAAGEVGEVAGALRGMADRVARQLRDQRALMAAVSHELRSPLGRLKVLVEMAREGSAPPTLHDDLEAEIDGMDRLVGDLLAAARIDFEAVSPRELEVGDVARRAVEIAGVGRIVEDGPSGTVHADATLLARALAGLLDNAHRYGGQTVVLRIADHGDRVRFEVEDDGPGFAPGDEERAFEPFWRGPADTKAPGVGLGLALVRQIAQAHEGAAGAENRAGGGARVWIEIPR